MRRRCRGLPSVSLVARSSKGSDFLSLPEQSSVIVLSHACAQTVFHPGNSMLPGFGVRTPEALERGIAHIG